QRVAAESEQKKLATLTIESQVAFASPREQAAFADELRGLITDLVKRYDSADNDARPFDLRVFSFPTEDPDEQDP
ncbi:MAG: hypothetical protein R3200_16425, partial [Xanthomonadales bacterium]|nr:hypothetical protein [Xanthomonadales bacterium]